MTPTIAFLKITSKVAMKLGWWPQLRNFYLHLFHKKLSLESEDALMERLSTFTPPISQKYGSSLCHNEIMGDYDLHVIVPAYKVEKYIEDCVDSILSQDTRYRIFLTIVNDGSPDRTREILRKYENLPNVEIIDQENKGHSGARNTALRVIRGTYLTFVDSDDQLLPGCIDAWLDKAFSTDADIVEGGYVHFVDNDKNGDIVRKQDSIGDKWLGVLFGFPWGKVYRASLFENLQFPEGYWFEDTLCSFLIYPQCKKIVTISDVVYRYRLNPNGITATCGGNPKVLDSLYITRSLLNDAKTLNIPLRGQLYDMFLFQVKMNYSRISSLKNSEVDKAVFAESVKMMDYYFPDCLTLRKDLKYIEMALRRKNYVLYLLSVI